MQRAFTPFDETKDPRYGEWKGEDKTDKCIPKIDGFVTDLVYATRGREVTSLYAVWSALFLISSVVQRDAWFTPPNGDPWLDKEFLNIYLLFIGPAGCGKSSAVNVVQKVLAKVLMDFKESENGVMKRKESVLISNMSTPEAFLSTLYSHTRGEEGQRRQLVVTDSDGQPRLIKAVANGVALVSEFGALLGKQNYMQGMSTALLELYDSPTAYRWNTVKRGHITIPEVYFNMLGATTADGISSNVNPSVLEDGFMSRTIMAYVPNFPRKRDFRFMTQCSMADLAKRLHWIAETQMGNYSLSPDARDYYSQWYQVFMNKMNEEPEKAGYMIRNRSLALKVAVLLKMGDYKPGRTVSIEHLEAAFHIIDYTYREVADLINYFVNAKVGAAKKAIITLLNSKRAGATRTMIANKSSRYSAETVDNAIRELWLEGKLVVVNDKGESSYGAEPKGFPAERYSAVRLKHRDEQFDIDESADLFGGDSESLSGWDASDYNSGEDEEEPVGDLSGSEREWG